MVIKPETHTGARVTSDSDPPKENGRGRGGNRAPRPRNYQRLVNLPVNCTAIKWLWTLEERFPETFKELERRIQEGWYVN